MNLLDMSGPCRLNKEEIKAAIKKKTCGTFALGYINKEGKFVVQYIGRADDDLRERLRQFISGGFSCFKFSIEKNARAAFEKECKKYHEFGKNRKLKNEIHPQRQFNSGWHCPVCDIYEKTENANESSFFGNSIPILKYKNLE